MKGPGHLERVSRDAFFFEESFRTACEIKKNLEVFI
jgi:hypothetical protein